jgi:hypothetical protein
MTSARFGKEVRRGAVAPPALLYAVSPGGTRGVAPQEKDALLVASSIQSDVTRLSKQASRCRNIERASNFLEQDGGWPTRLPVLLAHAVDLIDIEEAAIDARA